jgi:hypothetical protein
MCQRLYLRGPVPLPPYYSAYGSSGITQMPLYNDALSYSRPSAKALCATGPNGAGRLTPSPKQHLKQAIPTPYVHRHFQALIPDQPPQSSYPVLHVPVGPLLPVARHHAVQEHFTEDMRCIGAGVFADEGRPAVALFELTILDIFHQSCLALCRGRRESSNPQRPSATPWKGLSWATDHCMS